MLYPSLALDVGSRAVHVDVDDMGAYVVGVDAYKVADAEAGHTVFLIAKTGAAPTLKDPQTKWQTSQRAKP